MFKNKAYYFDIDNTDYVVEGNRIILADHIVVKYGLWDKVRFIDDDLV